MAAEVGSPAPEFTLPGTDSTDAGRRDYSLGEYRGQVVVLVFYPGDSTAVCTRLLNSYNEDIADDGEAWRITTPATELHAVRTALEEAGIAVSSSELTMIASATVAVDDSGVAKRVLALMDALDDNDDVQDVYSNFDIADELLEAIEA